jgi:hypothetical protein
MIGCLPVPPEYCSTCSGGDENAVVLLLYTARHLLLVHQLLATCSFPMQSPQISHVRKSPCHTHYLTPFLTTRLASRKITLARPAEKTSISAHPSSCNGIAYA